MLKRAVIVLLSLFATARQRMNEKALIEMQTLQAGSVRRLCTKFEADCSICSKFIKGVLKLGHVTLATPTYGSFYGPYAGMLRTLYQI